MAGIMPQGASLRLLSACESARRYNPATLMCALQAGVEIDSKEF
jgi:hypothetical protein